jgi:septum formation protein
MRHVAGGFYSPSINPFGLTAAAQSRRYARFTCQAPFPPIIDSFIGGVGHTRSVPAAHSVPLPGRDARQNLSACLHGLYMNLVLASASPRRRQLLENAGIRFVARPAAVDESIRVGEAPEQFVCRLAQDKAASVAQLSAAGDLVLGADTAVEIAGEILAKPNDAADAERMLRLLSGREHRVLTGICVIRAPNRVEALLHETTRVTFAVLDDEEISRYVASGEPFDKAGGYAIQGLASKFAIRVDGCFFNVVGLPVPLLYRTLKKLSRDEQCHEPLGGRVGQISLP